MKGSTPKSKYSICVKNKEIRKRFTVMMKYVCMYVCIYLSTKKGEGVRYGRNIYSDVLEWWRGVSGRRRQRDEWLVSILLFLLLLLLSCKYTPPCLCFHVCFLLALALRGFRNLHFMFLECVNMYVLFIRYISLYLSVCMCIVATPSCHFSFFLYISRSLSLSNPRMYNYYYNHYYYRYISLL